MDGCILRALLERAYKANLLYSTYRAICTNQDDRVVETNLRIVQVTLVVPWLAKGDQKAIFPNGITFESPEQQEEYVRSWVKNRTGNDCNFSIRFYPGRYASEKCSILPVGDPTTYITDAEVNFWR